MPKLPKVPKVLKMTEMTEMPKVPGMVKVPKVPEVLRMPKKSKKTRVMKDDLSLQDKKISCLSLAQTENAEPSIQDFVSHYLAEPSQRRSSRARAGL
jgi:hypothetical protein